MNVHRELFAIGARHHYAVDAFLRDLETLSARTGGQPLPADVERLVRALVAFLAAYGLRDQHGHPLMKESPCR